MSHPHRDHGFTLIELLVVVAIIALLIGLLLPSIGRARKTAEMVQCLSNMRQISLYLHVYTQDNDDFLPGPATSGAFITSNSVGNDPNYWRTRNRPLNEPLFNVDWVSPTMSEFLNFPKPTRRYERVGRILDHELRCPSNREVNLASTEYGVDIPRFDASDHTTVSYSMLLPFPVFGPPPPNASQDWLIETGRFYNTNLTSYGGTLRPSYSPKLSAIGSPAEFVYVLEGSRFHTSGAVSFNGLAWQLQGGNFMLYGPDDGRAGNPWGRLTTNNGQGRVDDYLERHAFRHFKKNHMALYDGSVKSVDGPEALRRWDRYHPRGAEVGGQRVQ